MKKAFLKNCYSLTLAILLLVQMGFHAVHALTSHHKVHTVDHTTFSDTQIQETYHNCELCAKLLGQKLYVEPLPEVSPSFTNSFHNSTFRETLISSRSFEILSLRGPPRVLC
ncbi:hypothetical protein [Poritiphilus flavus]|uniref:DUF2946 domain-containing protein n=1 Tax=Poritiphilus flavus TaxID=2697053 RepID=A0A6L9EC10_9FLAO|nr:hypothetical protein [Poritiphilus flavus]NAS12183.1 hypothetical protein [Poritiphilus flavus]